MPGNADRTLLNSALAGLKWNYIGMIVRVAMQLVAQIAIARLIGATEFGAASAAILIAAFSVLFVEMGISSALVQAESVSDADIRFAFMRTLQAGLFVAGLLFIAADWIADAVWREAGIAVLLRGMSLSVLAQGCGLTAQALLRRELDFKTIQQVQLVSYLLGFVCTGIPAALLGAGGWSLVLAWIVQNACCSLFLYAKTRHPVNPLTATGAPNPDLARYGRSILATNLANWVTENIDNFLVGRSFGARALGSYTVAYNLVRTPANHLVVAIQQVLFPASARAGDTNDAHRTTYLTLLWGLALVVFPIFFAVSALAVPIVALIYGAGWSEAAPLLSPLALALPFHALMAIGGPVLWGKGLARQEMGIQIGIAIAFLVLLIVLSDTSAVIMAWAVAAMYVVRSLAVQFKVCRALGIAAADALRAILPGISLGLVALIALGCVDGAVAGSQPGPAIRLGAGAFVFGLGIVSTGLCMPYLVPSRLASAIATSGRLPPRLRNWVLGR